MKNNSSEYFLTGYEISYFDWNENTLQQITLEKTWLVPCNQKVNHVHKFNHIFSCLQETNQELIGLVGPNLLIRNGVRILFLNKINWIRLLSSVYTVFCSYYD